jgi:hypothetical protein
MIFLRHRGTKQCCKAVAGDMHHGPFIIAPLSIVRQSTSARAVILLRQHTPSYHEKIMKKSRNYDARVTHSRLAEDTIEWRAKLADE